MRRLFLRVGDWRRRWRLLLAVGLALAGAALLAGPHVRAWYHLRAGAAELGRYHTAAARRHLEVCLAAWPDSPQAHRLLSRAARRAGDYPLAEQHLRACQRLEKTASPETVMEWALFHASVGDLDSSEEYLLSLATGEGEPATLAREALAEGCLRTSRVRDALACLDIWLEQQPDNIRALALRGSLWRQMKGPQRAIPDYEHLLELELNDLDAHWWLSLCLLQIGRYEEALKHLERIQQERPDDEEVQVQVARCQHRLGRTNQARKLLESVLAAHPDHGLALRTLGEIALMAGRLTEAEQWLRQAIRAAPADYQAQYSLVMALRRPGKEAEVKEQTAHMERLKERLDRVEEISNQLLPVRPRDAALHCELGKLYLSLGNKEAALNWLLSAVRLAPDNAAAHAALAEYYQAEGDQTRAAEHRQLAAARR